MRYDWSGRRWSRVKHMARYGTAVALAVLLVVVASQVVTNEG